MQRNENPHDSAINYMGEMKQKGGMPRGFERREAKVLQFGVAA